MQHMPECMTYHMAIGTLVIIGKAHLHYYIYIYYIIYIILYIIYIYILYTLCAKIHGLPGGQRIYCI